MYHYTMPNECRECGSSNYERFNRPNGDWGIRCLQCNHEWIKQHNTIPVQTGSVYIHNSKALKF